MIHRLRPGALAAVLAVAGALPALSIGHGSAHAYGAADHPLAQVEFSGNCNNPSFPFCAQPPEGVGTGGIWFWIEIDQGGTGDVDGAVCFHTVGESGPGRAGAEPIRGEISWWYADGANLPPGVESFGIDPGGQYYVVELPTGELFAFPVTNGHYSLNPAPGVSIQTTVAP